MMMLSDKVYVGLEHAPHAFDMCSRVLGQGGANLDFIRSETGAMVILKGGSGDKMNPLHLALNHHRGERLAAARTLALSLVESVRQEYQLWSSQNAPAMPALNVPPPVIVNPPAVASVSAQVPTMPPPSMPAAPPSALLNVTPMQPQVLQLVPQQQIFVAQDGTHYVKVTFAQTPTANAAPLTAMSLGPQQVQGAAMSVMAQQPPQGYAQHAQAPIVETLSNMVPSPSVCSAPTLSTPSMSHRDQQWGQHMGGHSGGGGGMQPWASAPQQVAPVPAPAAVQVNTAAPPPMNVAATNAWGLSASGQQQQQNANRPWGEPKQTTQQQTNQTNSLGGNIPWYKNLQNTASAPQQNKQNDNRSPRAPRVIVDEWTESSDQNNSGTGMPPSWAAASVSANPKAAMPDLLEEINNEKEGDDEGSINKSRRDYGRESRSGRREHRRDRRRERRPYTDADVYRRQFRSGGVLGEERNGGEENSTQQEAENKQQTHMDQQSKDLSPQGQRSMQGGPPHDRYLAPQGSLRHVQGQPQANPPAPSSKWDRPAPNQPQPTNQYNQPNSYHQQQQHQYHNQQYQQQPNQQKPPTSGSENQSANYDKQTPTTQYVGAPTQYTASSNSNWPNYYYNNETKPTWNQSQSQHPWNRNTQAYQEGQGSEGQYGQRPWHNTNSTLPPPPPAPPIDNPPSGYWSGY